MHNIDPLISFGPHKVAMVAYHMFLHLWYYLVIGIFIGVAFNVFMPRGTLNRLKRNASGTGAIFAATLIGIISPLGSYAAIPTLVAFLRIGIPLATVMAFLTASPLINPYMFAITFQILGAKMAFARLLSAVTIGVLTGLSFKYLGRFRPFRNGSTAIGVPSFAKEMSLSQEIEHRDNPDPPGTGGEKAGGLANPNRWKSFFRECFKMTRYAGKWFVMSIILAAFIDVYVPADWVVKSLGGNTYSLVLAAGMAIPLYVCGGGAVPFIWELMRSGMDQGAALTFFIAGPVTRVAPMLTVISLLGFPSFIGYFSISMFAALALGFLYHFV
jgi:uncharacterized membrane protein YraQ (UPF0718 family)